MLDDEAKRAAKNAWKRRQQDSQWERLGLTAEQLADLRDHLEQVDECDHSLRATQEWALAAGIDWPDLENRLRDLGGGCDCEVLANVDPEDW